MKNLSQDFTTAVGCLVGLHASEQETEWKVLVNLFYVLSGTGFPFRATNEILLRPVLCT